MRICRNGEMIDITPEEAKEHIFIDTASYEEKIVREIRNKYSVNDELSLLRQRDSKPEEFNEYFNYVESIKDKLKTV